MNTSTTHTSDNAAARGAQETHQKRRMEVGFLAILQEALTVPGVVNEAYRAFRNYSIGNQILAAMQLISRGLPLTPIASFHTWKQLGRFVKKGQKAINLFLPVSVRRQEKDSSARAEEGEAGEGGTFNVFVLRPNWFSLDQTEGAEFLPEIVVPSWDATTALEALSITEEPFHSLQ